MRGSLSALSIDADNEMVDKTEYKIFDGDLASV